MEGRDFALPRAARLSGKAAFDRVFAGPLRRNTRYFRFFIGNVVDDAAMARLGMAVSRRVDKRSVVRNRLRRQIRESFRLMLAELPAVDVVVSARPEAASASREAAWLDLRDGWAKLKEGLTAATARRQPIESSK